ncbi:hypothetical protein ACFFVB_18425 [Formosa undariae]|uniref:Uncharacterized protein n=1 Tax=Formosa undariae TaxID=1325436 RepID=A0ABV5F6J3_9FLAO
MEKPKHIELKTFDKIKIWLIKQKWLWKKMAFDNGIEGSNYCRFDHRLFSYSMGSRNNGGDEDLPSIIEWHVKLFKSKFYK